MLVSKRYYSLVLVIGLISVLLVSCLGNQGSNLIETYVAQFTIEYVYYTASSSLTLTSTITPTTTPPVETPKPPENEEAVRVEELNPILWWFIVRDQKGSGTYKRVMEGEYKLVWDQNGRIIDAYDSNGTQVDAVLFPKGGFFFGWDAVEITENAPDMILGKLPVVNMGEIVRSESEIGGIKYDFTSVRILVGVGEEEFDEYLLPFGFVCHDPDYGDIGRAGLSIMGKGNKWYGIIGEERISKIFTRSDNLYKQIFVSFRLEAVETPSYFIGPDATEDRVEFYTVWLRLIKDLDRYNLLRQHKWPISGDIFGVVDAIDSRLEGVPDW